MKHFELKVLVVLAMATAPTLWASAPKGQYTDLGGGAAKDNKTGLIWQSIAQPSVTWDSANALCKNLSLGGFASGWRVPTKLELETLVDYRALPPSPTIDALAFPTPLGVYWTATTIESCSDAGISDAGQSDAGPCETLVCGIDFRTGLEDLFAKSLKSYFRCVHGP